MSSKRIMPIVGINYSYSKHLAKLVEFVSNLGYEVKLLMPNTVDLDIDILILYDEATCPPVGGMQVRGNIPPKDTSDPVTKQFYQDCFNSYLEQKIPIIGVTTGFLYLSRILGFRIKNVENLNKKETIDVIIDTPLIEKQYSLTIQKPTQYLDVSKDKVNSLIKTKNFEFVYSLIKGHIAGTQLSLKEDTTVIAKLLSYYARNSNAGGRTDKGTGSRPSAELPVSKG